MGGSNSKETLTLENNGILSHLDINDPPAECPLIILRPEDGSSKSAAMSTPDEQLKAALAPFQHLLTLESAPNAVPEEQVELLKCLKANDGDSLHCNKEIHEFVGFVNKLSLCTPSDAQ
ncbi:Hypothetical predicted protein [Cloeon dipterum]|uniref:Uncharacterized protein n=1 Tax=Cloeon dipterum TaxID=197152 RepID=A0A8S1CGK4_9INSE|nr:Hypothetical predicted protein [Cloeon dipterum]